VREEENNFNVLEKKDEYIVTVSGKKFHLFNPSEDEVDINDIAHALSMTCRFNCHIPVFYSVASHSLIGSRLIAKKFSKEFLCHDFAEAYTGDCITPIKRRLTEWGELEQRIEKTINKKIGVPFPMTKECKDMDNLMFRMEYAYLVGNKTDEIFPLTKKEFFKEINKPFDKIAKDLVKQFKKITLEELS